LAYESEAASGTKQCADARAYCPTLHSVNDFAQRREFSQLQKDHAHVLLPAGESLGMLLATMASDNGPKIADGQCCGYDLCEQTTTFGDFRFRFVASRFFSTFKIPRFGDLFCSVRSTSDDSEKLV
jgi:hypothetical protein